MNTQQLQKVLARSAEMALAVVRDSAAGTLSASHIAGALAREAFRHIISDEELLREVLEAE